MVVRAVKYHYFSTLIASALSPGSPVQDYLFLPGAGRFVGSSSEPAEEFVEHLTKSLRFVLSWTPPE